MEGPTHCAASMRTVSRCAGGRQWGARPPPGLAELPAPTRAPPPLQTQGRAEGPVHRAAVALADAGALVAIKGAATLLVEAGVCEPLAAIAAAIITTASGGRRVTLT